MLIDALGAGEYWGCFPAGTEVRTARGMIPIEQVVEGDLVLTHMNRWRKVLRTFSREHDDELTRLTVAGLPRLEPAIAATPNHEFYVVTRDELIPKRRQLYYKRDRDAIPRSEGKLNFLRELTFDWVPAGELRVGDYVTQPIPQGEDSALVARWGSLDVAFLAGVYAAEGCCSERNDHDKLPETDPVANVVFVVGDHEPGYRDRITEAAKRLGHISTPTPVAGHSVRIWLAWADFARFCRDNIGRGSTKKFISNDLLSMPREWQKVFLDGYMTGDGNIVSSAHGYGTRKITTASYALAMGVRIMLARLGILGQIDGRHNTASTFYNGNPIYNVSIGGSNYLPGGSRNVEGFIHPDGYILSPIRKAETSPWSGTVYNLEVEEDNSYVTRGIAVHNSNVNGDIFPEAALEHDGPDYGARTFELYAHPFKHHANKDPARAYGDKVTMARYYKPTGRVQLIVAYHNDKAKDIIEDVDGGNYPSVSMGARVPNDRCTICGNLAKTRANYCEHAKYQMGKILSDGRQVGVINDRPKFFDISVVLVGAEKASHILKKVAQSQRAYAVSSAEAWDKLSGDKVSAQTKDADIDKEVPSNLPPDEQVRPVSELMDAASDVKNTEKTISGKELDDLAGFPMKELYSTLAALGIPLKPHEFQRVMLVKSGQRKLAEELWRDGVVFDESSGVPPRDSTGLTYDPRAVNEKIAFMLRPYLRERSIYPEAIEARVVGFEKRAEDWYNQKARQPPPSLLIPVMVTLAGAYKMFKDRLPQVQRGAFERSVEAHPWLLPLLLGLGFATAAAARTALTPIQLHNQAPFDGSVYAKYAVDKSASWKRLGVIPAAYAYSGVQRHRAMQGEHLNWLDRTVAQRPEIAALGGFLLAPSLGRGLKRVGLSKGASAAGDLAMMSVASGPKFIPGVLAGMAIDMGVVKGLQSIAGRRKRHNADNARRAPGLVQPLG